MAVTNPKGRAYFQKLFSKPDGLTPQTIREIQARKETQDGREDEVVEPISRVKASLDTGDADNAIVEPPKKNRKRDRSSRWSHSSPHHHRHGADNFSQPLSETIFGASRRFSEFVHTNLDGPS